MVVSNRDWHIKINDGSSTRRLRLLRTEQGLAWQVREESLTPRVSENPTSLSFDSLPADRMIAFAQDNWSWGVGLDKFLNGNASVGATARLSDAINCDLSTPGRIRHSPIYAEIGDVDEAVVQFILFDDKLYMISSGHIYSWDGSTFSTETTQTGLTDGAAVFNGELYVPRGPSTAYATWDGGTFDATPTPADPGGVGGKITNFAVVGNKLWAAHDTNRVSFIQEASTVWESGSITAGIRIGDGHAITNLFSISGLLFIATENAVYVLDSDNVPHDVAKHWRIMPSSDNFTALAESGGEVFLANAYTNKLWRISAVDFETFSMQEAGPMFDSPEKPVNVDQDLVMRDEIYGVALSQEAIFLHATSTEYGATIYKGIDRGGSNITWSQFFSTGTIESPIGLARLSGEKAVFVYYYSTVDDSVREVPVDNWPTNSGALYADTWIAETPKFTGNLETWDKLWWRLKIIVEKVGDGIAGTLQIEGQADDGGYTTIGTIGNTDPSGEYTFALPSTYVGGNVQLKFTGSSGNSSADGVDLLGFSLEGALRPEYVPLYDFSVVATNKAEADFLKGLRTLTTSLTLTDRFDEDKTLFVLPGYPVEQEIRDETQREPVRVYRILAQETPSTS